MVNLKGKKIVLFDGVCNLCNSSVIFLLKHNKKQNLLFTSLQSDVAKEILLQYPSKKNEMNSLIYIENEIFYEQSLAAIKISKELSNGFSVFYYLKYIPKIIRDLLYNIVAKNRYFLFGKRKSCFVPNEKDKARFL